MWPTRVLVVGPMVLLVILPTASMVRCMPSSWPSACACDWLGGNVPCALHEDLPCALKVWNTRDCFPQFTLFIQPLGDFFLHKMMGNHWCPKDFHPFWVPNLITEVLDVRWANCFSVPDSGLSRVQPDACSHLQLLSENIVWRPCAVCGRHKVHFANTW